MSVRQFYFVPSAITHWNLLLPPLDPLPLSAEAQLKNCALRDTSMRFGTRLLWLQTVDLKTGTQSGLTRDACGSHFSKWLTYKFLLPLSKLILEIEI